MNFKKIAVMIAFFCVVILLHSEDVKDRKTLFEDKFESPDIKKDWVVESGKWEIKNGCLFSQDEGIISIERSFENFIIETDIKVSKWTSRYPWISVIFFYENKDNNSFLTISPLESFYYIRAVENSEQSTVIGGKIPFDSEKMHRVKLVCLYNRVSFYWDNVLISSVNLDCIGKKIAFANINGVNFEMKNIRIQEIQEVPGKIVKEIKSEDFMESKIMEDYKFGCELRKDKKTILDKAKIILPYDFSDAKDFRGTFLSLPVNIEKDANKICLTLKGDASQNKFFIIVHDKSGEQHLLYTKTITWNDALEIKIDMTDFFKAPTDGTVEATHWSGDQNQKIDFPITKLDVGICKREKMLKTKGLVEISNFRFEE